MGLCYHNKHYIILVPVLHTFSLYKRADFIFPLLSSYNNPANQSFGVLRVMNDDLEQPARGFGEHPHSNVEICTYVVGGHLTHKDSMGTEEEETLSRGAVQFMTAGCASSNISTNRNRALFFL